MIVKHKKFRFALFLTAVSLVFLAVLWLIFSKPATRQEKTGAHKGLNLLLPAATLSHDSGKGKLDFYSFALADSLKKQENMRSDPYRKDPAEGIVADVHAKLAETRSKPRLYVPREMIEPMDWGSNRTLTSDVNRPAQPPAVVSVLDPEMAAINATLDKIAALQQPPPTAAERRTAVAPESIVYAVDAGEHRDETFFGRHAGSSSAARFFGQSAKSTDQRGIRARIAGAQQVQSGSMVKMELLTAVNVRGINLPTGTLLFGIAYLEGERLRVQVPSIRYGNLILPVSLQVFDLDGLEGIFIPGSLPSEVVKEAEGHAVESVAAGGLSLVSRAVSAGLGVAKSLFSKKLRQVQVSLHNGYQVLLQDKQQNVVQ